MKTSFLASVMFQHAGVGCGRSSPTHYRGMRLSSRLYSLRLLPVIRFYVNIEKLGGSQEGSRPYSTTYVAEEVEEVIPVSPRH